MDAITSAKKKAKDKKKKQQTPIVGDLTEMEEALPTLELLMKKSTQPTLKRSEAGAFSTGLQLFVHVMR